MNNSKTQNGNGTAQSALDMKNLEMIEEKEVNNLLASAEATAKAKPKNKTRKKSDLNNAIQYINLTLDAGSHNCKAMIDGFYNSFASMYREVKGELPTGMAGVFSYKTKNYVVGNLSKNFQGTETVHAYQDNKITKLDIWLVGALTYDCDFLDSLIADKKRANKYNKPIRLHINLKLLSLSSTKKGDITKKLNELKSFTYRNKEFEVDFINLNEEYVFSEGFGAALTAQSMNPDDREFYVLDLGGGTLTITQYVCGRELPKANDRIIATGGGMQIVSAEIYKSVSKSSDRGGQSIERSGIMAALKACREKDDNYYVPYSLGRKNINIAESIPDALQNWINENPTIEEVLSEARRAMNGGFKVYGTGGGLAAKVISDWLTEYLKDDIEDGFFEVLQNPHKINVSGMKQLDRELNPKSKKSKPGDSTDS